MMAANTFKDCGTKVELSGDEFMTYPRRIYAIACLACFASLCGAASAQMVKPYNPSAPVGQPTQGGPPVRAAPSPESKNLVTAQGIREVTATPGESSVVISFRAWQSLVPVIEIGTERPVAVAGGRLEFANRLAKVDAAPTPNKNEISPTGYTASIPNLERGTRYYYLISASDGASLRQYRGRFTTASVRTNVTVVYTKIDVTNDSDDGGNGELFFTFRANYPNNSSASYGDSNKNTLSWNDEDPARQINEVIEVGDAPERLELAVNGFDDDSTPLTTADLPPGGDYFRPLDRPFDMALLEGNVARQTFNLGDFPGEEVRHDFVLDSMPHAAAQGDLSFKVEGYFVIKREKTNP